MRVIAGTAKGRILRSRRGREVRPTSDMLRESLFAILGEGVLGCRFLDLYAGSGAVGIEAASRGAARVTFVEKTPEVLRVLRQNLTVTGMTDRARVIRGDAVKACQRLAGAGEVFDVVFLDPPYAALEGKALAAAGSLVGRKGRVVVQHAWKTPVPVAQGLRVLSTRRYGDSALTFLEPESGGQSDA